MQTISSSSESSPVLAARTLDRGRNNGSSSRNVESDDDQPRSPVKAAGQKPKRLVWSDDDDDAEPLIVPYVPLNH